MPISDSGCYYKLINTEIPYTQRYIFFYIYKYINSCIVFLPGLLIEGLTNYVHYHI